MKAETIFLYDSLSHLFARVGSSAPRVQQIVQCLDGSVVLKIHLVHLYSKTAVLRFHAVQSIKIGESLRCNIYCQSVFDSSFLFGTSADVRARVLALSAACFAAGTCGFSRA